MHKPKPTLPATAAALADGSVSSVALTEQALARIADKYGEGKLAFTRVYADAAMATARAHDALRAQGIRVSPLAGIPVSIKDLFDVAGDVTLAGSKLKATAAPAAADAPAIARLRRAGAVIVGKTNMSEFAFSGLGLNPHYGTPASPWDRANRRIPGGSSSGGAVSVSDGMAMATIGTDTGGSLRIPAAFCELVGFKPTAGRISTEGAFPLSQSLDSVGPMANSVRCCAMLDAILANDPTLLGDPSGLADRTPMPLAGLRLGVLQGYVLDGLDDTVAAGFAQALRWLAAAGAHVRDLSLPELQRIPDINRKGGLIAAEAWAIHRQDLEEPARSALFDQRIVARIRRGADMTSADYIEVLQERAALNLRLRAMAAPVDLLVMPSVAIVPPMAAPLDADDALFASTNALVLRNTTVANFMGACSLSLPCNIPGSAPVGLMLVAPGGADRRLLRLGQAIEQALNHARGVNLA
ncbi:amidase [Lacisediminimonas sp.]|uniref:amidase n=1 Tax=Lacisediminimonas sp. TaxID=3060582 RepID=UPI0027263452|nr:amidase [Lacisediminimonas sp.]MDO8300280.1 amidase [Lacisediminimonas sp.]